MTCSEWPRGKLHIIDPQSIEKATPSTLEALRDGGDTSSSNNEYQDLAASET